MNEQDSRRLADLEAAQARAGQDKAEFQRDVVAGVAVNEALNRVAAEDATSQANMRATVAESRERSMATSAGLARQDARYERTSASNATFSATLIGVFAVAIVAAVIGYFAWWQPNHPVVVAGSNTFIRTDKTTETTVPAPTSQPPTVIVTPPTVNVNVPESKPEAESKTPANDPSTGTSSEKTPDTSSNSDNPKSPETKSGTDNP